MRRFFGHRKLVCKGRFCGYLYYGTYQGHPLLLSGFRGKYPNQGYREEESIKELMRIKPLYTFNDTDFDSDRLKSLGIKTVRGPRHMTEELVQALSLT